MTKGKGAFNGGEAWLPENSCFLLERWERLQRTERGQNLFKIYERRGEVSPRLDDDETRSRWLRPLHALSYSNEFRKVIF